MLLPLLEIGRARAWRWVIGLGLVVVCLGATTADAQRVNIHGVSQHFNTDDFIYNERNWGAGYEHDLWAGSYAEVALGGGVYHNSFRNTSVYISSVLTLPREAVLQVGLIGMLVTGYDGTHRDPEGNALDLSHTSAITPIVMPGLAVGRTIQVRAAVLPAPNGFVTGQLSIDLSDW